MTLSACKEVVHLQRATYLKHTAPVNDPFTYLTGLMDHHAMVVHKPLLAAWHDVHQYVTVLSSL